MAKGESLSKPLFTTYPVPKVYIPTINTKSSKQGKDFTIFEMKYYGIPAKRY